MKDLVNSVPLHLEPYEVFDLSTEESHGTFETLEQARGCVRFDKLRAYSIWKSNVRVECCDLYEGDDDRVKQALGEPNASEQEEAFLQEHLASEGEGMANDHPDGCFYCGSSLHHSQDCQHREEGR